MVTISGAGGMALSARFPVEADLSPFQAQVNEAVKNALVRFGILRDDENAKFETVVTKKKATSEKEREAEKKRWVWMTESEMKRAESARARTEFSYKMVLRMVTSEAMQTFNMVSNLAGWSKNQTYQLITSTITGVVGLISTANLAASTLGVIPGIGPALAAMSVGNAVAGSILNITLSANAAAVSAANDAMGYRLDGGGL